MVAVPRKLVAGVNSTLVPTMMDAVPFVGATEIMLKLPPGVSTTSLFNGVNVLPVFSGIE